MCIAPIAQTSQGNTCRSSSIFKISFFFLTDEMFCLNRVFSKALSVISMANLTFLENRCRLGQNRSVAEVTVKCNGIITITPSFFVAVNR